MKLFPFAVALSLLFASFSFAQGSEINVIPRPQSVMPGKGTFTLTRKTKIVAKEDYSRRAASELNDLLQQSFGFKLLIVQETRDKNSIKFDGMDRMLRSDSTYGLRVDPDQIRIVGAEQGMYYGIQTLAQLFPIYKDGGAKIPTVEIFDTPRFSYRGMHLDVARHFMPVSFVKKYIDLMAQFKFNQFHWHLTDDQGWRIEIKKYPKLTEIGSKRSESHEGPYTTTFKGDGRPVEGYYTQDEIRDVVAYAKTRFINVIPEIELPGHASAALAAYPEFGCKTDYKYEVQKTWGIFPEVYCPTDATFKFLEDVLDETIKLFPDSPYIHIGGDEVLKDHWKQSPFVQDLMKREGLKDEHEVQSYFVRRIEKYINSKGKKIIGWDEILEGGLAPNAAVMSWRGTKGGIEAARADHDVIMTPTDFCYFDYNQGDPGSEPLNIGGYLTLEKVYSFEPVPTELSADEAKHILGGQANIWSEYLETPAAVEYMAFPRMLALSEVLWSKKEDRDFADFERRLGSILPRLDKQDVNYHIPVPKNLRNRVISKDRGFAIENIYSEIPGARVLYTTDGSEPTIRSPKIPAKFLIDPKEGEIRTLKTIVVLPSGRKSSVYSATYMLGEMHEPVEIEDAKPGVMAVIETGHEGGTLTEETKSILLSQFKDRSDIPRPFDLIFGGSFRAPADGIYEFKIDATGAAALGIAEERITIEGKGERVSGSVLVALKKGLHPIQINYGKYTGQDDKLYIKWAIRGQNWHDLSDGWLFH